MVATAPGVFCDSSEYKRLLVLAVFLLVIGKREISHRVHSVNRCCIAVIFGLPLGILVLLYTNSKKLTVRMLLLSSSLISNRPAYRSASSNRASVPHAVAEMCLTTKCLVSGVLYETYNLDCYYWDVYALARRVLLIGLSVAYYAVRGLACF